MFNHRKYTPMKSSDILNQFKTETVLPWIRNRDLTSMYASDWTTI